MSFTITGLATSPAPGSRPRAPLRLAAAPPEAPKKRPRQHGPKSSDRPLRPAAPEGEPLTTQQLRTRIFPTLYAIFQQSRGKPTALKIKNRTLRSLIRSCLYHKSEDQLQRTQEDAEALLRKYCAHLQPDF